MPFIHPLSHSKMATSGKDLDDSEATAQPTTTQHPQQEKGNFSTGYECEFVEPPPEILATECSVCLHIPREPHQVSCCGQHFCKSCIEHTWSENKPCPLCNRPDFTATLDKSVQRHLNALNVYCTNRRKGCEWMGELRHLDHHLNANPRSGEELTGCEFVELSCIHGCGESFQRHSLPEHHNNCPSRPFSCEYCGHSSTYQDVVNSHWPECPQYPLQCPNSCQDSQIERQHLGDHLNKECPLEKVNCEFQYAGCTAQVQRRDLAAHMRDNLPQHISQLSNTTRLLAADIRDEIKQKFEQHKMEQYQQKAGGMVKQEQAEAKARQEDQLQELKRMIKTASDNTQRRTQQTQTSLQHTKASLSQYSMIMAATILAFVALFAAVIIMQRQQIQQQREDHIKSTELIQQLRQDHIEATKQLRHDNIKATEQLRQDHIKATELIQQLRQDHTEATEQLRQDHNDTTEQMEQLRQDHIEATEQIQQLRQDHIKATEQLRQDHIKATEQLRQDHIEATEQIQQLRQDHIKATEQLRQDHIKATELIQQLRQDHTEATEQLRRDHIKATEQLRQDHIKATEQIEQLRQGHIEATELIQQLRQLRQDHKDTTEKLSDDLQHLQYELHVAPVLVSPSMCTAEGPGLLSTTMNKASEFTVSVVNILGLPYSGERVNVIAELQSEEDGSIKQAHISFVEASKYRVTFTPIVRGWNKLYVKINNNNNNIKGSPFSIFVSPENPQEIGGLNQPWGIAINSHGEIFVTEWGGDRVSVFGTSRQNRTIGSTGTGDGKFRFPAGIDIDADDNVYVASKLKLQKFNRNGEHVIKSVGSRKGIRGVKVHNERVYVCDRDNDHILVYGLELTFLREFGTRGTGEGEFISPYDIDFDAKGNAYVTDSGNNRVQVLKEDGQFLREFGREKLIDPLGIHIAGDYVYVSLSSKVVVFRTSGDFVTTIGENFGTVYGITTVRLQIQSVSLYYNLSIGNLPLVSLLCSCPPHYIQYSNLYTLVFVFFITVLFQHALICSFIIKMFLFFLSFFCLCIH